MAARAAEPYPASGGSENEDRKRSVRDLFAALSERRFADIRQMHTCDASWWQLTRRSSRPIQDYLDGYERQTASAFPEGLRLKVTGLVAEDNKVAAQVVSFGITERGREYSNDYHFLLEFQGPRICSVWEYGDTLYAERILRG